MANAFVIDITASLTSTGELTVSAVSAASLAPGQVVTGTGVPDGAYIVNQLTGPTGDVGRYTLSVTGLTISSRAMLIEKKAIPFIMLFAPPTPRKPAKAAEGGSGFVLNLDEPHRNERMHLKYLDGQAQYGPIKDEGLRQELRRYFSNPFLAVAQDQEQLRATVVEERKAAHTLQERLAPYTRGRKRDDEKFRRVKALGDKHQTLRALELWNHPDARALRNEFDTFERFRNVLCKESPRRGRGKKLKTK